MGVMGNTDAGQPITSTCDLLGQDCAYIRNIAGTLHCEDSSGFLKACVQTDAPTPAPTFAPTKRATAPQPVVIYQQIPVGAECTGRLEIDAIHTDDRSKFSIADCSTTALTPNNEVLTCLAKMFERNSAAFDSEVTMSDAGVRHGGCVFRLAVDYETLQAANTAGMYANSSSFREDMSRCLSTEFESTDEGLPAHFKTPRVNVLVDKCTGGMATAAATAPKENASGTSTIWTTFNIVLVACVGVLVMLLLVALVVFGRRQETGAIPDTPAAAPLQPQASTVSQIDEPPPLLPQEFKEEEEEEDELEPEDFDDIL
jgi:hypothetical protein